MNLLSSLLSLFIVFGNYLSPDVKPSLQMVTKSRPQNTLVPLINELLLRSWFTLEQVPCVILGDSGVSGRGGVSVLRVSLVQETDTYTNDDDIQRDLPKTAPQMPGRQPCTQEPCLTSRGGPGS